MKTILLLVSVAIPCAALGQRSEPYPVDTSVLRTTFMDEIVISANKIPEPRRMVSQQIQVISEPAIKLMNAQTTAELIANSGTVTMQKSQQGGGSPMLRGFEASRVLLVIDGVRMNNLIYRSGHLQNLITTDNNTLERAEILLGPSSTVYGSDALGGVIHLHTKSPPLGEAGKRNPGELNMFARYGSVNNELTSHFDLSIPGKKFASFTSFTYSAFDDLRMGEKINPAWGEAFGERPQFVERAADNSQDMLIQNPDRFVQKASGYDQGDVLQKFIFKPGKKTQHGLNFQHSTSSNIPRYDRLTDPEGSNRLRFSEWYYGPQKRLMAAYNFQFHEVGSMADDFFLTASFQDIKESRHSRRFNNNSLSNRMEHVNVWGLTADFQKRIKANRIRYGIDGQFNTLKSTAFSKDIVTNVVSPLDTRYPDGDNYMNQLSIYGTHTLEISNKLILNDGLRFGGSWLYSSFIDKTFFPFPFDEVKQNNVIGSANIGLIYAPTSWKLSVMASSGFRVPNVDDLGKVFDSQPGVVIVPNPDLAPEKTINGDISVTKFFEEKVRLEGVFFATSFKDAIVTSPGTFNGQTIIDYEGVPSQVMSNQNVGQAYLYGYSILGKATLIENLTLNASYNYTHGRVKNNNGSNTPMDHIAPTFGRISLQYHLEKFNAEVFSNFNGWKRLSDYSNSGEDNLNYATSDGMPSWYTLNFRISAEYIKGITIQAGIDNIMDLQYRTFASGINGPGRNILVTARIKVFEIK